MKPASQAGLIWAGSPPAGYNTRMGVTFLLQLAAGAVAMAAACRRDHVARSYIRLISLVSIALLAAAAIGASGSWRPGDLWHPAWWMLGAAAAVLLAMPSRQADSPHSWARVQRGLQMIAAALMILATASSAPGPTRAASVAAMALGSWLIGGATAGMLLGHAYLTQTQMPIDPLMRLTRLLALGVCVKCAWTAGVLAVHRTMLQSATPDAMWLWLMLSVRVGVGLLGLGVLIYMIHDCVRRRSTQSATGILYIAMIFAFLGELSALELSRTFQLST